MLRKLSSSLFGIENYSYRNLSIGSDSMISNKDEISIRNTNSINVIAKNKNIAIVVEDYAELLWQSKIFVLGI